MQLISILGLRVNNLQSCVYIFVFVEQILRKSIFLPCTPLPVPCAPSWEEHPYSPPLRRPAFPRLMCTSQDHRSPSPGSYVLSHCLPTSVPLHTWLCTSFTPLFMKILPMLADITDATYLFIHSFHKFVLNNSYCQALNWMLRKPCQTSTTSSIFPFFESDLHFYTVK